MSRFSLESVPSAFFNLLSTIPQNIWSAIFFPAPAYTASEVSTTQLLVPLACFGVLMAFSVVVGWFWLFVVAALGFVWVDTQMAFKIHQKTFEEGKKKYNTLVAESVTNAQRLVPSFIERRDPEKPLPIAKPLEILSHKDFMASHFGGGITTSAVCVFPAQVMTTRLSSEQQAQVESDIARSLQSQLQQQLTRQHILHTVLEEEDPSPSTQALTDLPAVQRELAEVLSRRRLDSFTSLDESLASSSVYSRATNASMENLFRPMHPPPPAEVDDISSMEELDFENLGTSSSSSSITSTRESPRKDHTFPIIDNVISDYTNSLHSMSLENLHRVNTMPSSPEDEFSGDDTRDGIFSRPESRASSVSVYSEDEEQHVPAEQKLAKPSAPRASVDIMGITRPISPKRRTPHRKNNGWKTLPKKARLSKSAKRRFLSKPFW